VDACIHTLPCTYVRARFTAPSPARLRPLSHPPARVEKTVNILPFQLQSDKDVVLVLTYYSVSFLDFLLSLNLIGNAPSILANISVPR
jgi:hypothetical protein